MARCVRTGFLYVVATIIFCATAYLQGVICPVIHSTIFKAAAFSSPATINEEEGEKLSLSPSSSEHVSSTSVLLPDWEVLVIVSPESTLSLTSALHHEGYMCLFDTGDVSPAVFSGNLLSPDRATFKCVFPRRARRRLPFRQPLLIKSRPENDEPPSLPPVLRWTYLVYDSLTTDKDVILFVKGVNNRQGVNREPSEFWCVFGEDLVDGVRTVVTSSMQEVFRCQLPDPDVRPGWIKVSLEIAAENWVVPSVAYYSPPRKLEARDEKSVLCATTMVYNVAKFLKEWVLYHSKIGVEKFLLYDNESDDNLGTIVDELVQQGFQISTYYWRWPKTQEAGFSHSVVYAKDACTWMMYVDVDEFVYSPSWQKSPNPVQSMLHSLIAPRKTPDGLELGQVSIGCHEFGPSNLTSHPLMGVTQGYNCRRKYENRHKSIVLLDAIEDTLLNVIHHFNLRPKFRTKKLSVEDIVVNHYKYQAWPEFKAKFRRRVSAYVLDWTQKLNPHSNDRTPGLGFTPDEPQGWPQKFCEVNDNTLRMLTWKWFGNNSSSSTPQMAWQR